MLRQGGNRMGHEQFTWVSVIPGLSRFIATSGGFAEVVDDKVTLLLDTAEFGEEIDLARAQRAREWAESTLKGLTFEHAEYQAFEAALLRAITRISTASRSEQ
jgi:F-type H+-transporting ATPase subunit epsilon